MKIACLGWGSLVWDPRSLPISAVWFQDGPLLPVEFIRCSSDGRITLALDPKSRAVRVLWALMLLSDLDAAIGALRVREGITSRDSRGVGYWSSDRASTHQFSTQIGAWALGRGLDAVIWTALKPKHPNKDQNVRPSGDDIIKYLKKLKGEKQSKAKKYVMQAPLQIDTDYRRRIQNELNWMPSD